MEWARLIDKVTSKSLWMMMYCTGCGAIEMPPTVTSRWDVERFGIMPMATPRQADIFLITGYLTKKTLKRVIYVYEQMPEPKYVIAHGSCPIDGGIYYDSYNTINRLDLFIPVDLYIQGCMPRAEAVMDALLKLREMVEKGEANAWQKYHENFEYYDKNQKALFGENWRAVMTL
ncbi:NADH-quinone oxidoreductase subunit NuoB [Coprothermobacteraceae bacterium]|nr:NADH-quinone oxidoreductase subunit NuoB [Coprothermobacteraceae bacterium]